MEQIAGLCFLSTDGHDTNSTHTQLMQLAVASNSMVYLIDQIEK
jgi:hypothetical protein